MHTFVEDIKASKFRNIGSYPIIDAKIEKLINSMDKTGELKKIEIGGKSYQTHTGFWDNINVAVTDSNYQKELESVKFLPMIDQLKFTHKAFKAGVLMQANGHHRIAALRKAGIEIIDVPVRYMNDSTLLSIMVHENLESFGGTAFTTLESVSTTAKFIMDGIAGTKTFDSYKDKMKRDLVFTSAKQYSAAVKAGAPSVRVMQSFFGSDGMDKNSIQAGLTALKFITAGVFSESLVQQFPTTESLRMFNSLTNKLLNTDLPRGIQLYLIKDCATHVLEYKPSGRDITAAGTQAAAGKDPLAMLKNGMISPFKLSKYVTKLIRDDVSVRNLEGMETDTAKAAIADAEKYIEAQSLREARAARKEQLEKEGKEPQEIVDTLVEENLMTRVSTPEGGEEEGGSIDAGLVDPDAPPAPFHPNEDGLVNVPDRNSVSSIMNYAHASMVTTGRQLSSLINRVDEAKDSIETAGMVDTFFPGIERMFKVLTYLMLEHQGKDKVRKLITAATKVPATEAGLNVAIVKVVADESEAA